MVIAAETMVQHKLYLGDEENFRFLPNINEIVWPALVVCVGIVVTRLCIQGFCGPLADLCLTKDKQTKNRRDRFVVMLFKVLYFALISPLEYIALRELNFFPPALGGEGEVSISTMYPRDGPGMMHTRLQSSGVWVLYVVALAYHTHSLIFQFFYTHRGDFGIMISHHIATLLLIAGSFHFNYCRWGVLVMYIHDLSDMWAYFDKMLVDTAWRRLNVSVHVFLSLFAWPYLRCYVFPKYIIYGAYTTLTWHCANSFDYQFETFANIPGKTLYGWSFVFLMAFLFVLHSYWEYMLLKLLYDAFTTGKREDQPGAQWLPEKKEKTL